MPRATLKPVQVGLGLGLGLWLSTWLAMAHPLAPFFLAYLVFGAVLWNVHSEQVR
jgi:hypothetical protein